MSFYDKAVTIESKLAYANQESKLLKEQLANYEGQITILQVFLNRMISVCQIKLD